MNFVIGISGQISSGKTTLAAALAETLSCPMASFGDFVRKVAKESEASGERLSLQDIGQSLVDGDCRQFCEDVIQSANWTRGQALVVDGIRHVEAWKNVCQIVSQKETCLVVVSTSESIRARRNKNKDKKMLAQLDKHPVEADSIDSLPEIADMRLDGSRNVSDLVHEIIEFVKDHNR
ncbi:AAA family ATPase [uncultured Gimesia sp.]|uniref:AAA family ATPase n=1 Tax=uncultured Gimesia sp. TaxID=1678688 RepID=UPI0030D9B7F4|tara:strand:- start:34968 stop:35501 length:534 start_codon:yes stop_codon:yes gene_type:complete